MKVSRMHDACEYWVALEQGENYLNSLQAPLTSDLLTPLDYLDRPCGFAIIQ